jgi:soluble lytic murein transglycosylase-like protein
MKVKKEEIFKWAERYRTENEIDKELLYAVAKVESSLNSLAYNKISGANGLFQFTEIGLRHAMELANFPINPTIPEDSTRGAKAYFSWLYKVWGKDNLRMWLYSWNWGYGNVRKWLTGEKLKLPKETQKFAQKVIKIYRKEKGLDTF